MVCVVIAVGMAACSGVRRGTAARPPHKMNADAAPGGGHTGNAHGLPAAVTVERYRRGRTQDEEAVHQAFSEALPDLRD
jgi:hypothetical protein